MTNDVSVSRDVAAPPERVWSLVSDITRMGEWSPETTSCSWIGGATGAEVGARFRGKNRNGWRRWSTLCRVVEADPGRTFAFDVEAGPVKIARWSYRIAPTDTGCTLTETWTDQRAGWMKVPSRLISGVSDRAEHNRHSMTSTIDRLAGAAEAAEPAP